MPYIYLIRLNGNPKYIGFTTKDINFRFKQHVVAAKYGSSFILHKAIKKYGEENFTIECLMEHNDAEFLLNVMEPKFIHEYKTYTDLGEGYNMTLGGEGSSGMSEEVKEKISKSLKGRKGRSPSLETREKLSNLYKGKKLSEQTKAKMSISSSKRMTKEEREYLSKINSGKNHPQYGKPKSEETKKKISETLKKRYSTLPKLPRSYSDKMD